MDRQTDGWRDRLTHKRMEHLITTSNPRTFQAGGIKSDPYVALCFYLLAPIKTSSRHNCYGVKQAGDDNLKSGFLKRDIRLP